MIEPSPKSGKSQLPSQEREHELYEKLRALEGGGGGDSEGSNAVARASVIAAIKRMKDANQATADSRKELVIAILRYKHGLAGRGKWMPIVDELASALGKSPRSTHRFLASSCDNQTAEAEPAPSPHPGTTSYKRSASLDAASTTERLRAEAAHRSSQRLRRKTLSESDLAFLTHLAADIEARAAHTSKVPNDLAVKLVQQVMAATGLSISDLGASQVATK